MTESPKVDSFEAFNEEFISLDKFLPTEIIENTEIDFYNKFSGFNFLEVKLLNHENYTEEEINQMKEVLLEYNEKVKNNFKGYDVRTEYPNEEDFLNFDYTETKVKLEQLELIETDESDTSFDITENKDF